MAKIAVDFSEETPGETRARRIAHGPGWTVDDVLCTAGPRDRPFEEQHARVNIAIVAAGTFQYRSRFSRELMTPGSLLLGNAGECFECGHEHAAGDRCISFGFDPHYFEQLAADAGARRLEFPVGRIPALAPMSAVIAQTMSSIKSEDAAWEEIAIRIAAAAVQTAHDVRPSRSADASSMARVTRVLRHIEHEPESAYTLASLARAARLSPYHFLRIFESVAGVTPHQYIRRMRLRDAAARLAQSPARISDVALDCGFGDISNFNRAFRAEFGMPPKQWDKSV